MRRGPSSIAANPVLIGAATTLVTIVAVFLAYNANNGLPFVPRYSLHVQVRDATELTQNAEVHMAGGSLVGHVTSIDPARTSNGQTIAVLNLALNNSIEPLPANWKRVEFIDHGTHLAVRVDDRAYGEIRPAA